MADGLPTVTFQDCPHKDWVFSRQMAWSMGYNEALAKSAARGAPRHTEALKLARELIEWADAGPGFTPADDIPEMQAIRDNTVKVCRALVALSETALIPPEVEARLLQEAIEYLHLRGQHEAALMLKHSRHQLLKEAANVTKPA